MRKLDHFLKLMAKFGRPAPAGCSEHDIQRLLSESTDTLGVALPAPYLDLLRLVDGFSFNGLDFFGSDRQANRSSGTTGVIGFNRSMRADFPSFVDRIVVARDEAYFHIWTIDKGTFDSVLLDTPDYRVRAHSDFSSMIEFAADFSTPPDLKLPAAEG